MRNPNLRLAQEGGRDLMCLIPMRISPCKLISSSPFPFECLMPMSILWLSCRGQGGPPEPPPKKQKVASKKDVAANKKTAEASAPPKPTPAALDESRRKGKEDTAQTTAPPASASHQHVSSLMILCNLRKSQRAPGYLNRCRWLWKTFGYTDLLILLLACFRHGLHGL